MSPRLCATDCGRWSRRSAGGVAALRDAGADPVILAAMGSHGGGTAEGQLRVLTHLGITEKALGAPVLSSMEVVELGRTPGGFAVYLDRNAAYCDGIVVGVPTQNQTTPPRPRAGAR